MASKTKFEYNNEYTEEGELIGSFFKKHGIAGVPKYTKEILNKWREIPLHIAVTGKAGAGKSTFINVMRGLKIGQEGAADTDVKECTKTLKSYHHPKYENIVFWDLPGVGTENCKRKNYYDQVKLGNYDFFLIFSSERFLENDGWLAKEIGKMDKRFYFVRTKVLDEICNDAKGRMSPRPRDEILETIREECLQNLEQYGLSDSPVYLIDNFETDDFDFNTLQEKIVEDTPKWKRQAMVFSIIGQAEEILLKKKEELEKRVQIVSLLSAVNGAIPLPVVNTAVDLGVMLNEVKFYRDQFGLTEDAIKRSAGMLGVREEELKRGLQMKDLIMNCTMNGLMSVCQALAITEAAEVVAKFVVPIVGSIAAGMISYKSTKHWLTKILEGLYQDALKISKKLSMHSAKSSSV